MPTPKKIGDIRIGNAPCKLALPILSRSDANDVNKHTETFVGSLHSLNPT